MTRTPAWPVLVALALLLVQAGSGAATPVTPVHDDEVLETLAAPTLRQSGAVAANAQAPDMAAALRQARADITLARQTGDTRYWGRAQAVLAPWWDQPAAPADMAVLQATVQQGRHEFGPAQRVLQQALARASGHAQGWLELAALERLQANYGASLRACDAVGRTVAALYAQACRLETLSLQEGPQGSALPQLQRLADTSTDPIQRSWLLSLLAEALERAGQDAAAQRAYRASLAAQHDLYTAVALGDLLLRTGQLEAALQVLDPLPPTDAVLVRRASAWRRLADARWQSIRAELRTRAAELRRRGDNPDTHGREATQLALWLDGDPRQALALARRNLQLQREPVDWWLALHSAQQVNDQAAWLELDAARKATGLRDRRIDGMRAPAQQGG